MTHFILYSSSVHQHYSCKITFLQQLQCEQLFATALTSNFQNSEKSRQLRNDFAHFVLLHFYHVAKTKQNPQKQHLKVREANACQISSLCCQSILSNKHSCEKSGKTEILGHVFLAKSAPQMGIPSPAPETYYLTPVQFPPFFHCFYLFS